MKNLLLFTALQIFSSTCFTQVSVELGFTLKDEILSQNIQNGVDINILEEYAELKDITIKCDLEPNHELHISINGKTEIYSKDNESVSFKFKQNIIGSEIKVEHWDKTNDPAIALTKDEIKFRIINDLKKEEESTDDSDLSENCISCAIDSRLKSSITGMDYTPLGLYRKSDNSIHMFFDQYGNSLLSTIPQGISNAKYFVHIIYPYTGSEDVSYSIKQTSGTFNSGLVLNNSGIRNDLGTFSPQSGKDVIAIGEREFLLGTATDDLSFEIIATTNNSKKSVKKIVLESYTIQMSPVFHASFDVGLLRTNLSNPTFSLVQSPNDPNLVVKETNINPTGVVTIMVSAYTSPIILLESLSKKKKSIPHYKLYGRNFLDDHKFYERIYPTVGVSLSSRTFENLFFGFNFEISRGLNFFCGWHYGKVNVFNMPNYVSGETPVTQEQFDFYTNTKWRTSTTFGVKLDALIIRNLFGT